LLIAFGMTLVLWFPIALVALWLGARLETYGAFAQAVPVVVSFAFASAAMGLAIAHIAPGDFRRGALLAIPLAALVVTALGMGPTLLGAMVFLLLSAVGLPSAALGLRLRRRV
jgi:hypothetical protein